MSGRKKRPGFAKSPAIEAYRREVEASLGSTVPYQDARMLMLTAHSVKEAVRVLKESAP